jgi:hypothetical protein
MSNQGNKQTPATEIANNNPANLLEHGSSLFSAFGFKFHNTGLIGGGDTLKHTTFFDESKTTGTYTPMPTDVRIFNIDDPYHALVNTTDQDFIFAYGIQMRYYRVKPIEEQTTYDPLYGEAPSREYENGALMRSGKFAELAEINPLVVWGLKTVEEPSQQLTNFAMDTTRTTVIYLNITYARSVLGRDPMIGDVIAVWDIPELFAEVTKVVSTSKTLYVPRRWKLSCTNIQLSR